MAGMEYKARKMLERSQTGSSRREGEWEDSASSSSSSSLKSYPRFSKNGTLELCETEPTTNEKPQGWSAAKKQWKGTLFQCYRCKVPFTKRDDLIQHVENRKNECETYKRTKEDDEIDREARLKEPRPVAKYSCDTDPKIAIPETTVERLRKLLEKTPFTSTLGQVDLDDVAEIERRATEYRQEENREKRGRGEKVKYSWSGERKKRGVRTQEPALPLSATADIDAFLLQ